MVDASTFVQVRTSIEAGAVPRLSFGRGLLVTTDARLSAGGADKARLFNDIRDVSDFFGSAGDTTAAARVWFGADPQPQGLYIGRWANTDVETSLTGATLTTAPTAGGFIASNAAFGINGQDVTVDLSGATNDTYTKIAATIQAAIIALGGVLLGVSFVYDTDHFVLTFAGGDPITGGVFTAPGTGTDISEDVGMGAASNPTYVQGLDAEGITAGVDAMLATAVGASPVFVMLADDVPDLVGVIDTRNALRDHAQASEFVYALLDTADQALVTGDTTSHAALAFADQQDHVAAVYGVAGEKPDVGIMALMSAQNFDLPASIITVHGKTMPSVTAADLTGSQIDELERKRTNTYALVGDTPRALGSYTSRAGYWLDAVVWLLWLRSAVEARIWNTITASRRYTNSLLYDDLIRVLDLGVTNGGIQPGGTVSAATKADIIAATGNQDFDGTLTAGYLVHINPLNQADRTNRVARFTVWVAGTEAIHRVFGDIRFTN